MGDNSSDISVCLSRLWRVEYLVTVLMILRQRVWAMVYCCCCMWSVCRGGRRVILDVACMVSELRVGSGSGWFCDCGSFEGVDEFFSADNASNADSWA